ncbi:MAG: SDR family NAD(P)-dependent oxidoreductase [Woeseiaceae bacterium]|nr:SDR family NAD(P)-dependent oxidoreductase [Woeseiaceae bacterium]
MIFNNKTVIITGASEGVGAATARKFAEAGANLMLVARGKKKLEAIAAELRDKTQVEIFAMDVSDPEACVNVFKKADFEFGRIDVLVNNAGFHARGNVDSVSPEDLGRMIDVNLRAPIMLTRIALPYIRDAGGGAIINVGSLAGRAPIPGSTAYSASKSGLRAFTYAIAEEMPNSKIKFAIVSPGPIDTGFIMSDIDKVSDLTFSQPISTADDVAQAILDLCGNNQREQSMPAISGVLTTVSYLFPWLARKMRPWLEKRGQQTKARLKAEARRKKKSSRGNGQKNGGEKPADDAGTEPEDQKPK